MAPPASSSFGFYIQQFLGRREMQVVGSVLVDLDNAMQVRYQFDIEPSASLDMARISLLLITSVTSRVVRRHSPAKPDIAAVIRCLNVGPLRCYAGAGKEIEVTAPFRARPFETIISITGAGGTMRASSAVVRLTSRSRASSCCPDRAMRRA